MSVNPNRVIIRSTTTYKGGTVIYQMCRELRVEDNDALLFAQELAKSFHAPLIVNYVIWNYEWEGANRRFYDWVLPSLQEIENELRRYSIPLVVTFENERSPLRRPARELPPHIGAVVIDQLPLRFMRRWKEDFLKKHPATPLYEVDAHNCIPVWKTSDKQEFSARTIRRKIHSLVEEYLEEYVVLEAHHENQGLLKTLIPLDWNDITSKIRCKEEVTGVGMFTPGTRAAHKVLIDFLHNKLSSYDIDRNDCNRDGQSNLSPYLSHGAISARRVLLTLLTYVRSTTPHRTLTELFDAVANGSNGYMGSVASFIEECLVRRELAENFCYYNTSYDSFEGFPSWAKETLRKASSDTRDYMYTKEQFKEAVTHDELWNAAQKQMVETGKMHGYMRMYWAKKILEWSKSPQEAMKIAVALNDTYELDGRDPNGYASCAWSIGGLHDRSWFGRPIFGTIRYMAKSGVVKRSKVEEYIKRWTSFRQG